MDMTAAIETMKDAAWLRDRETLLDLLKSYGLKTGHFKLTSGKESDYLIDCKPVLLSRHGHFLTGRLLYPLVRALDGYYAAGVAVGGCPLASAVAAYSSYHPYDTFVDAIYVRKEAKEHGTGKQVERPINCADGSTVVLLEDVVTTGGSSVRAVQALREDGFNVTGVISLVDRGEGGALALTKADVPSVALFTRRDFMGDV